MKRILALFSILGALLQYSCKESKEEHRPPNVILIVADDMNGYGTFGQYEVVKMPYLEKLSHEATVFTAAVCNSPVCNPSRSSFFSGLHPHHTGAYLNGSNGWNRSEILQKALSIPEWFKSQGYTTWGRGKIFHNPLDSVRHYGMWDNRPIYMGGFGPFPEEEYWDGGRKFHSIKAWTGPDSDFPDIKNADAAIDFLDQEHEKPFFLYYGLWRPHSPYTAPERFFDLYEGVEFPDPPGYLKGDLEDVPKLGQDLVDSLKNIRYPGGQEDLELWKKFVKAYCANSSFADWNIGRVIEALDNSVYAENTLVIFFSDNGFHCGEKERWGKSTLWEQADNVSMMVRTPGEKGVACDATVSLVDVYPTLVEYCGLDGPTTHQLDGQSMVPLLRNPSADWNRPSFTSYGIEYSGVRSRDYRYCRYPDGKEELYDRRSDPYEFNNIAGNPGTREIMDEMARHIPTEWAPSLGGRLEVKVDYRGKEAFMSEE